MIRLFALAILFLASLAAPILGIAAECRKTGEVCVDGPSTKNINGSPVYRSCWRYKNTYECVAPDNIDYCAGIRQISGCYQTSSVCSKRAFNGDCLLYTNTFRCGDSINPPVGVVQLDNAYTVTTDTIDRSQCESYSSNPSCTLAQKTCTEPGGTRIINGLPVTKDCWKWDETYSCIAQNYKNYCIPIRQTEGCVEVANTCKSYAWNNTCNEYERTFRCDGKVGEPLPTKVTYLNTEYTIIKDNLNTAQCQPNSSNPNCVLASRTCVQPGGTRNINGLDVYKDCWEWSEEYVCASTELKSDCADLKNNPACTEKGSVCLDSLPAGQCGLLERKFQCTVKEGSVKEITTCDSGICVNGDCTAPSTNPDMDFAKVVSGMEIQREMGDYFDPDTNQLFKGVASSCSIKLGGLSNCCKAKGGGASQANNFMIEGVKMFGNEAVRYAGSTYMYDALFSIDLVPTELLSAIYGEGAGASYTFGGNGNFSFYGISYAPGASPPFAFDPTSFAIAIAMQVITQFLQCDQEEQLLGLRKDQRLCTPVGSWCSSKVLGVCIEKSEGYCCYNSRLSRIINEQGRAQIGKVYGSPKNPDCSGFTVAELDGLDFGKMDLSEFIDDIVPKDLNTTLLNERAQRTIQERTSNYFNGATVKP